MRWLGSLLALTASALASTQNPVTIDTLDRLVTQYRALHLPFPPDDARLVKAPTTFLPSRLFYELPANANTPTRYLLGTQTVSGHSTQGWVTDTTDLSEQPFVTVPDDPPFEQDTPIVIAVIEHTRGHDDLARSILREPYSYQAGHVGPYELHAPTGSSLELRLAYLARQHWLNQITDPTTNWVEAARELRNLVAHYVQLQDSWTMKTLGQLEQTVSKRDLTYEYDDLIDGLCGGKGEAINSHFYNLASSDSRQLTALVDLGPVIVPTLIRHITDERLSGSVEPVDSMGDVRFVTVGDVCKRLTDQFTGDGLMVMGVPPDPPHDQAQATLHWAKFATMSEEHWLRSRLLDTDGDWGPVATYIAQKRHAQLIPVGYRAALKRGTFRYPGFMLKAALDSPLPRPTVAKLAFESCKSNNIDFVVAGLCALSQIKDKRFDSELLKAMVRMPDGRIPTLRSHEILAPSSLVLAQAVRLSDSAPVWQRYAKLAMRSEPEMRVKLLAEVSHRSRAVPVPKLYLKFFCGFLNDASPLSEAGRRDLSFDPLLSRLRNVHNMVAVMAARCLDVMSVPSSDASVETWDAFRQRVRDAIRQATH